jgi:hypothetical protein
MTYSLRIVDLPATERPRERLLSHGVKNLKNAELIAILLGTGQGPGKLSAIGLGEYILNYMGQHQRDPLERLRDVCPQELMDIPGVGPAKATAILAAIELGQRACLLRKCPQSRVSPLPPGKIRNPTFGCQESAARHSVDDDRYRNRNPRTPTGNFSRTAQTRSHQSDRRAQSSIW